MVDQNQNVNAVLQQCEKKNIKLKAQTVFKIYMLFIGHVLTRNCLCVDSNKVKAMQEMPSPHDVAAITN